MSTSIPDKVDLSKYVVTQKYGERPHIRGRRLPIAMIVYSAQGNGWSVAETAHEFSLSEAEVLAALLYYEEHRDEIDRLEAEEQIKFDEMKSRYGES